MARRHITGNTVSEYVIIGLVVLAVAVLGMMELSESIRGQMFGFGHSLQRVPVNNQSIRSAVIEAKQKDVKALSIASDAKIASSKVLAPSSVEAIQETVMVSGSNGATKSLASVLAAYAKQLQANGEITEEQADGLIHLSNAGHELAAGLSLIENARIHQVSSQTLNFNGRSYSSAAAMSGDFRVSNDVGTNIVDIIRDIGPDEMHGGQVMERFLNVYREVKSKGAMDNPAVASVVRQLASQIVLLSDVAADYTQNNADAIGETYKQSIANEYMGAAAQLNFINPATEDISEQTASELVDINSTRICDKADGLDTGKQCSSLK